MCSESLVNCCQARMDSFYRILRCESRQTTTQLELGSARGFWPLNAALLRRKWVLPRLWVRCFLVYLHLNMKKWCQTNHRLLHESAAALASDGDDEAVCVCLKTGWSRSVSGTEREQIHAAGTLWDHSCWCFYKLGTSHNHTNNRNPEQLLKV